MKNIDGNVLSQSEMQPIQTHLYGNQDYSWSINRLIINSTIKYLISNEKLSQMLVFN